MPRLTPIKLRVRDRRLANLRRHLIDAYYGECEPAEGLAHVVRNARRYATYAGMKVSKVLDVLDLVGAEPVTDRRNRLTGVKISGVGEIRVRPVRLGSRQVKPGRVVVRLSTGEITIHRRYQPPYDSPHRAGTGASPPAGSAGPTQRGQEEA